MNPDEQVVYVTCLLRIYETGEPIKDDAAIISRRTHLSLKRVETALQSLLDTPKKLYRTIDGRMANPMADETIETMRERRQYAVKSGEIGADKRWRKNKEQQDLRERRLWEAREKGTHTDQQWDRLLGFCRGRCLKCQSESEIVKDHIVPISHGGSDSINNIQPLCATCNAKKGARDTKDLRPEGWKNVVFSKNESWQPQTDKDSPGGYLQLQDSLFPSGNRALAESEKPKKPVKEPTPLEIARKELFDRGKEVLGDGAGGMIQKLLAAKHGNIALARAAIEQASTMDNPREYIGAIIRGGINGKTANAKIGFSGIAARIRRGGLAEEESFRTAPEDLEPVNRR